MSADCGSRTSATDEDHEITNNQTENSSVVCSSASSPSKNRRKRRNRNKNKGNIKTTQQGATDTPSFAPQGVTKMTKLAISKKANTKPKTWKKMNNSSALQHIMNEQQLQQRPTYGYSEEELSEQSLIEQQMIMQAIAESTRMHAQLVDDNDGNGNNHTNSNADDEKKKNDDRDKDTTTTSTNADTDTSANGDPTTSTDNKSKNDALNEMTAASLQHEDSHHFSDELFAIAVQKQEEKALRRQQKMSKMYDGKFAKVTSADSHKAAIPNSALQFCYNDESMLNGARTKQQQQQQQTEQMVQSPSKHDAKKWSEKHLHRLNEYETGGDIGDFDCNFTMSNQCYNNFRNQLDKKGFISYHNYQLQPNANGKRKR